MKIYVASSWRNEYFDDVFEELDLRFDHVYNFKEDGFNWSKLNTVPPVLAQSWTFPMYKEALKNAECEIGFNRDKVALDSASAAVLVLPCGASAHLELGYAVGRKQFTAIYKPPNEPFEPELMYKFVDLITDDLRELIPALNKYQTAIELGADLDYYGRRS